MKSINNNDPIELKAVNNGPSIITLFPEAAEAETFTVEFAEVLCAAVVAAILVAAARVVTALVVETLMVALCLFKVVLINGISILSALPCESRLKTNSSQAREPYVSASTSTQVSQSVEKTPGSRGASDE